MRHFRLTELERPLIGRLSGEDVKFDTVSTDTRSLQPGDLFVALRGPSFDGHRFVSRAADAGASAALVSEQVTCPLPALHVADTRQALGQLAALNRQHFAGKLVGITGSSGKTTVKNMLASILRLRGPTLATLGNLNNEIGLPLTLLRLQEQHQFAVIEMGASRTDDIRYLCELAQPDVALLLNALPAHLEGFGDIAGVAAAKGEILTGLAAGGTAVINADSQFASLWRRMVEVENIIEFGLSGNATVSARELVDRGIFGMSFRLLTVQGEALVELSLPGQHNVMNALAASATALAVGAGLQEIVAGLAAVEAEPGRMQVTTAPNGMVLVDDSYNANPGSVAAAIDLLAACDGRRILVLGTMGELGSSSDRLHQQVGDYARQSGIDELWLSGAETRATARGYGAGARHCRDLGELAERMRGRFAGGDVVLVKGSRSAGMEAIVTALLEAAGEEG